jgi:hypothetical protein
MRAPDSYLAKKETERKQQRQTTERKQALESPRPVGLRQRSEQIAELKLVRRKKPQSATTHSRKKRKRSKTRG